MHILENDYWSTYAPLHGKKCWMRCARCGVARPADELAHAREREESADVQPTTSSISLRARFLISRKPYERTLFYRGLRAALLSVPPVL